MTFSGYEHLIERDLLSLDLAYYFLFVFLHFIAEPTRWILYLRSLRPSNFGTLLRVFSFTALATYLLPLKLGVPLRIWLLKARAGLELPHISGIMLLDGLLYYGSWAVSVLLTIGPIGYSGSRLSTGLGSGALVVATIVIVVLLAGRVLFRKRSSRIDASTTGRDGRISRLRGGARKVVAQYHALGKWPVCLAIFICALDITSHVLRHWALLNVLGQDLPLPQIAAITCISVFSGLVSMMPMGLGGYDIVLVLLLRQVGVPDEIAIATPLLNRAGNVAMSLVLGVWGAWGLGISFLDRAWLRKRLGRS